MQDKEKPIPEVNEWVAVFNIVKLYIAKVVNIKDKKVTVSYLDQKAGEVFEMKKRSEEEIGLKDIFIRNVTVSLTGKTGYTVQDLPST